MKKIALTSILLVSAFLLAGCTLEQKEDVATKSDMSDLKEEILQQMEQKIQSSQEALKNELQPQETTSTEAVDTSTWEKYTNEKYSFSLKFPETWNGYTVKEKQLKWGTNGTSNSLDFGFKQSKNGKQENVVLFNVAMLTKKQWNSISSNEEITKPLMIKQTDSYVYVYSISEDTTGDNASKISDIKNIISTFSTTDSEDVNLQ